MIAAAGVTLSHGLTISSLVGARSEVVQVSGLNHWYREVRVPLPEGATLRYRRVVSYTLGAPDAWATAWVRDDGKKLYAALDSASDDTDDPGADFAELWASAPGKPPRRYRVTVEDPKHTAGASL